MATELVAQSESFQALVEECKAIITETYREMDCLSETTRDEAGTITDSKLNRIKLKLAVFLVNSLRAFGEE